MSLECGSCGHANAPDARFCNRCGALLPEGQQPTLDIARSGAAPAPEMPMPGELLREGTVLAGRYRIGRELGRGAFGIVMEARDLGSDALVAVKLLNVFLMASPAEARGLRERFAREWAATSRLDHPRVARALRVGEERGVPFIVMERVEGRTLAEVLATSPPSREQGLRILRDVLEALGHAHRLGIIHRDVKPSNVMVELDGSARLMDFGIAKVMETLSGSVTTQTGLLGTPSYMSPEQAAGKALDPRSDLFSVGLVAYEVLSGRRAFDGHPGAVIGQILSRPVPDLPTLPSALGAWLRKACARAPEERFADAGEMAAALVRATPSSAPSSSSPAVAAAPRSVAAPAPSPRTLASPPPPPRPLPHSSPPRQEPGARRKLAPTPRFRYLMALGSTAFLVMLMIPRSNVMTARPPAPSAAASVVEPAASVSDLPRRNEASADGAGAPAKEVAGERERRPAAPVEAPVPPPAPASEPVASKQEVARVASRDDAESEIVLNAKKVVTAPSSEHEGADKAADRAAALGAEADGIASLDSSRIELVGVDLEAHVARVRDASGTIHLLRAGDRLADAVVGRVERDELVLFLLDAQGVMRNEAGEEPAERRLRLGEDE